MEENNNITIGDLAVMVKKGFDETAKKEDVDVRFNNIDERLDKLESNVEEIRNLILASHKRKIEKIESELKEVRELLAIN